MRDTSLACHSERPKGLASRRSEESASFASYAFEFRVQNPQDSRRTLYIEFSIFATAFFERIMWNSWWKCGGKPVDRLWKNGGKHDFSRYFSAFFRHSGPKPGPFSPLPQKLCPLPGRKPDGTRRKSRHCDKNHASEQQKIPEIFFAFFQKLEKI
jgi:hypothetical protein